jgi:Putative mono-oxygenase ydhR
MALTLLQFDFPAQGPWGPTMAAAYGELAQHIAAAPGLIWKVWTENPVVGEAGGIYLFADPESAEAYRLLHTERLQSFGITQITAKTFSVNEPLSAVTRVPLAHVQP